MKKKSSIEYSYKAIGFSYIGIILLILLTTLTSCGLTHKFTDEELQRRAEIQYEMDKLWSEYSYKSDSLYIELYKTNKNK